MASPSAGDSETTEDGCGEASGATQAAPRWQWSTARMSGAAAALVGSLGMAAYWLAPMGIDQIKAEARPALENQDAGRSASLDTAIIVQPPDSVRLPPAELNTPNYNSVITAQAMPTRVQEVWPSTFSGRPLVSSVAVRRPAPRKGTVEARPAPNMLAPSIYVTRASKGIWLFPSNPNG